MNVGQAQLPPRALYAVMEKVVYTASNVGVAALMTLMLITTADVLLRYFLNTPIVGSDEVASLMLLFSVVLALPYCAFKNHLVSIDIVTAKLPARQRENLHLIIQMISMGMLMLMCWELFQHFLKMQRVGAETHILRLPISWGVLITALSFALLAGVFMLRIQQAALPLKTMGRRLAVICLGLLLIVVIWLLAYYGRKYIGRVDPILMGCLALISLFVVFLAEVPIFIGLSLIGFVGVCFLRGPVAGLSLVGSLPYSLLTEYHFSVIPLFILMGEFCFYSKLGQDLYLVAYRFLGSIRGGLAIATVGACGAFASVCGDSLATAVTMGTISLPEMRKYNYDDGLAIGAVAAGGTLGVLIPPSLIFILYSLLTSVSISDLFMAGVIPGFLLISLFCLSIFIKVSLKPSLAPPAPKSSRKEKLQSLKAVWAMLVLVIVVIGGMYTGFFTPTEGGAMGAFFAMVIGIARKRMGPKLIWKSLVEGTRISATCLSILMGASLFGYFLATTKLPIVLASAVAALPVPSMVILVTIMVIYLLLGCIMPAIPMLVLTVPIFFPVVTNLGFDPVWFGVLMVLQFEMSVITPPMGINVLAMRSVMPDVPIATSFIGIIPYLLAMIVCLTLLIIFPDIALFLPNLLRG